MPRIKNTRTQVITTHHYTLCSCQHNTMGSYVCALIYQNTYAASCSVLFNILVNCCYCILIVENNVCVCMCMLLLAPVPLGVIVKYERKNYTVQEEDGSVTLALVLNREASVNVTVTVRTLDLQDSSVGDNATGELLEFCLLMSLPGWPDAV